MNKKGFTIIELIATIALLSIIAAISFISISSVLEQNKVNNCESLKMNITSASKEYISDNRYTYTDKNDKEVTLFRLVNNKYLSISNKFMAKFRLQKDKWNNRKTHVYRTCPNCKATIKLPRKKGKHTCTCPKCRVDFSVKV